MVSITRDKQIGSSLFDEEGAAIVGELIEKAEKKGIKIHLPTDFVIANKFDKDANVSRPESLVIFYIISLSLSVSESTRKESITTFTTVIERAAIYHSLERPKGVFEFEKFAVGSKTVVMATEKGATSIIGKWVY